MLANLNKIISKNFIFSSKNILTDVQIKKLVDKECKKRELFKLDATLYQSYVELGGKWCHPHWSDIFIVILNKIEEKLKNSNDYYKNSQKDFSFEKYGRYEYFPLTDTEKIMYLFFIPKDGDYNTYCIMATEPKYKAVRSKYNPD